MNFFICIFICKILTRTNLVGKGDFSYDTFTSLKKNTYYDYYDYKFMFKISVFLDKKGHDYSFRKSLTTDLKSEKKASEDKEKSLKSESPSDKLIEEEKVEIGRVRT